MNAVALVVGLFLFGLNVYCGLVSFRNGCDWLCAYSVTAAVAVLFMLSQVAR